ncbi:unnamed protein product [Rhodiola kirilowii]
MEFDDLASMEFDEPADFATDDFASIVLSQLSISSLTEEYQHICTIIGAMSQELIKDQNHPLSPITYLCATCSSLDRLSTDPDSPVHTIDALLAILSLILARVSDAILLKKSEFVSGLVVRIMSSKPLSDGGVVSCIKCVSRLLTIKENVTWNDISPLYATLVSYITDFRPKVHRQAHLSTRDVLQYFQRVPALSPASEGITNILERSLLLAGGSCGNSAEGLKGAQEVLYVLDALKGCLPLLSAKYATSILKYYKTLLELGQPLVTRRIMDSLYLVCLCPSKEFAPEVLLDLLCSLALSASTSKTSADNMTFTCCLLAAGMERIYALNIEICVSKLPVVFKALKDILGSEHEEAVRASTEALKKLIHSCVDENMIKQGKDRLLMDVDVILSRAVPTIIEELCAITDSLLHYRFAQVCDMSFQVVSAMFDKLAVASYYLMSGTIKNLREWQMLPDEDFSFRKQLHECIGSAVSAMGPEMFLSLIPLNLDSENQSESNIWLFPILKNHTVGAKLSFYCHTILPMIGPLKMKAQQLESEGHLFSSRTTQGLIYSLWSLLPPFCNYPVDTADSFNLLEEPLCQHLCEQPDVWGLICSGLHLLIEQNKKIFEGRNDSSDTDLNTSTQRAMAHYTADVASENLKVLASSARNLLSVLAEIFINSDKDGGCLQSVIGEIASIAPEEVVSIIFNWVMGDLLDKTQQAENLKKLDQSMSMDVDISKTIMSLSHQRAQLLDLAASLLPELSADTLYVASELMLPFFWPRVVEESDYSADTQDEENTASNSDPVGLGWLREDDGIIQKKSYKVLSIIFKNCDGFVSSEHLELVVDQDVLTKCPLSAKHHRLDCLYFLIIHYLKSNSEQPIPDIINSFLTEIILALKEANKKTRNRAYDILVQLAHVYGDEDNGGEKEKLLQFFYMVAGHMVGETPRMKSAAVKGLARLTYEFSDLVSTAYRVLPSVYLLLQGENKEIVNAILGLLKVLIAKSSADGLHTHLKRMVQSLLNNCKQFKAKIKLLIEMLVKKCGIDAVKAVMPEEHMKLLANIRNLKERKERKMAAGSEESQSHMSKATTSRLSRWNHTRIFSDFDDETEGSDGEYGDAWAYSSRQNKASSPFDPNAPSLRSKRLNKAAKRLPEDLFDQLDDEPLDLLDRQKIRSSLRGNDTLKRKCESDDEFELDAEGRLLINEGRKTNNKKFSGDGTDTRIRATRAHSASCHKLTKRRKTSDSSKSYVGREYASKKAGGDLKKKDKLEPYAYWPLDRKMLSRKEEHSSAAKRGMASVVKLTKKLEGKSAKSA